MGSGNTITINDKAAFPAKVAAIRDAATQLDSAAGSLKDILELAQKESASFTATGSSAPVYGPLLDALRAWLDAVGPAVTSVCGSAENCAATAAEKFTRMTDTDSAAAGAVASI